MYSKWNIRKFFILKTFFLFLYFFTVSCASGLNDKNSLNDELVLNYIAVYKKLREKTPEALQKINQQETTSETAIQGFEEFERIIKDGGFDNFSQFVIINAKVGTIFTIIQANKSINDFEGIYEDSKNLIDENILQLEEQLKDTEIPENTKEEIREVILELKEGKSELDQNWIYNEKWASLVLTKVQKLSKIMVNEKDIELVLSLEDELMEAYIGFPMPKID